MKNVEGKVPYDLVPPHSEEGCALAFGEGRDKYKEDDWLNMDVEFLIAAAKRHLNAIRKGEVFDPDPRGYGLQHAYKAMASCAMIGELLRRQLPAEEDHPPQITVTFGSAATLDDQVITNTEQLEQLLKDRGEVKSGC